MNNPCAKCGLELKKNYSRCPNCEELKFAAESENKEWIDETEQKTYADLSGRTESNQDMGTEAATRVMRYGTLWDKIGNIINFLNIIGFFILLIFVSFSNFEIKYKLVGLLILVIVLGISYLQISIIRGLASYFQMRSADYLERRVIK
jgi:hypothetical protein